jgi:hypothetical protein
MTLPCRLSSYGRRHIIEGVSILGQIPNEPCPSIHSYSTLACLGIQ